MKSDGQSQNDTAFRSAERRFKIRSGCLPDTTNMVSRDYLDSEHLTEVQKKLDTTPHFLMYAFHNHEGAFFLPGLLTSDEQLFLTKEALCVYPDPSQGHDTNLLNLESIQRSQMQDDNAVFADDFQSHPGEHASESRLPPPTSDAKKRRLNEPKGAVSASPSTTTPIVHHTKALRWVTLGHWYKWAEKTYNKAHYSLFPASLSRLAQGKYDRAQQIAMTLPDVTFQTAIVNYYNDKSTLMGHTDTYEDANVLHLPLLTISLGRSAIFLLGGASKDVPPTPVLIQSGDALILSGPSRSAFHGVPAILPDTCPGFLTKVFPSFAGHRINLSLRQVYGPTTVGTQ